MKRILIALSLMMGHSSFSSMVAQTPVYLDETKPIEQRIEDALSRMTLDEKIAVIHAQFPRPLDRRRSSWRSS